MKFVLRPEYGPVKSGFICDMVDEEIINTGNYPEVDIARPWEFFLYKRKEWKLINSITIRHYFEQAGHTLLPEVEKPALEFWGEITMSLRWFHVSADWMPSFFNASPYRSLSGHDRMLTDRKNWKRYRRSYIRLVATNMGGRFDFSA